jgi:hypothetical protein
MDREPRVAEPEGANHDGPAAVAIVILAMLLIGLVISQAIL